MNILLINTSPVVSRLISIFLNENTFLDEFKNNSELKLSKYDLVFVDDESYVLEVKELLKNTPFLKKVLLSSQKTPNNVENYFDEVIQKPFLPSEIKRVIDSTVSHVKSNTEHTVGDAKASNILNKNEINKIKKILEEDESSKNSFTDENNYEVRKAEVITEHLESDGLEIVVEDEIANILSKKFNKENSKKKRKKDKSVKRKETVEDRFMLAVEHMGVKKLKKLLQGAEINISIKLKD